MLKLVFFSKCLKYREIGHQNKKYFEFFYVFPSPDKAQGIGLTLNRTPHPSTIDQKLLQAGGVPRFEKVLLTDSVGLASTQVDLKQLFEIINRQFHLGLVEWFH